MYGHDGYDRGFEQDYLECTWAEVFLSSFKLFRDMDTTLPPSEVRDLAVADANCVVETLRQKADADTTDKVCETGG